MNKIKWIIFDLGGIVVPEVSSLIYNRIAKVLNISDEKLKEIISKYHRQTTAGSMTFLEMYSIIVKEISSPVSPDYLLQEHLNAYRTLAKIHDADVVEYIETLKKDYKVACLSNLEIEIHDICSKTGLYDYFDQVFLSMEMKMQKPDLEIYLKVIEELKCLPNEIIFTDDRIENVTAANEIGIHGLHFSSLEKLKSDIANICNVPC